MDGRFGGDPAARERLLTELLYPVRDTVLDKARLRPGDTVLDVGAGDGLIAFGALERLAPSGHVVFSDISQDLLDHCRAAAAAEGLPDRCRFVLASADSLDGIADASVDVVTARSVLIYVKDKAEALRAFCRVLRPGGRISVFEPINVLMRDPGRLLGGDLHFEDRSAGPFLEHLEVPDRVPVVLPLLLEDHVQALQHGVVFPRVARTVGRDAVPLQFLCRRVGDHVAYLVHALPAGDSPGPDVFDHCPGVSQALGVCRSQLVALGPQPDALGIATFHLCRLRRPRELGRYGTTAKVAVKVDRLVFKMYRDTAEPLSGNSSVGAQ
jgi:ubiquinone/menaquinone biosynthesis C-methylase UbiE